MSYSLPRRKEIPVHRDELVELEQKLKDEVTKVQQQLKQLDSRHTEGQTLLWKEVHSLLEFQVFQQRSNMPLLDVINQLQKEVLCMCTKLGQLSNHMSEETEMNSTETQTNHTDGRPKEELPMFIPRTLAQHQQEDVNKAYSSMQAADIAKQEPRGVGLTEEEHTEAYFIQLANNATLR